LLGFVWFDIDFHLAGDDYSAAALTLWANRITDAGISVCYLALTATSAA
jgi:hypothetical protein